jgi:hypothetical protein
MNDGAERRGTHGIDVSDVQALINKGDLIADKLGQLKNEWGSLAQGKVADAGRVRALADELKQLIREAAGA